MGISGKVEELVNQAKLKTEPIPLIKRYSGGGTVVVDDQTLFVSFIFNKNDHDFPSFPEPILRWSADIYQKAWDLEGFALRENDYVLGDHKVGGNAQYIKKKPLGAPHDVFMGFRRGEDGLSLNAKKKARLSASPIT